MAWGKATSVDGDGTSAFSSSTFTSSDFMTILNFTEATTALNDYFRVGNNTIDSGSNYAWRSSQNGTSDGTGTSRSEGLINQSATTDAGEVGFRVIYVINKASEEKLFIGNVVDQVASGAGTAPNRRECANKWANTSNQINTVGSYTASGTYNANSNISVLGSDITPASAIPFAENAQLGSRAEITDSRKIYNFTDNPTIEDDFTSSTGWTQVTNTASGVVDGQLIGLTNSSGTNGAGAWKDYGLVSDTKFVLRCKFDILAQSGGSGNACSLYFGISDTNGATSPHSNRDGLGLVITNYASSGILWCYPDGQTWDNADTDLGLTPTVTTYYLEIARTSATSVTFKLFSDEYSTVVKTHTQTIASTLNGLRYLMFQEWRNGSASTTKVAVDDLQIFNGVGTVSGFTQWKEIGT